MKPSLIFHQYIWLVESLLHNKRMTLAQINRKWIDDEVAEGNPLSRTTFNRHRDAILDMFGVVIDCDLADDYKYYISNPEVLDSDTIERWMLSTLTVGTVLSDSLSIQDRIILENVPAGEAYLSLIIKAMKMNHRIKMGYQRFGADNYKLVVAPYALKLFHQRWYLLAFTGWYIVTYSLDRITSLSITDETFQKPADFSPEDYFSEYYGVLTDETPMAHVVIRAYGKTPNYLRTLPLHHSQREINTTPKYSDFSYDIRPTYDFQDALFSHVSGIEVLKPIELREKMKSEIEKMLENYK